MTSSPVSLEDCHVQDGAADVEQEEDGEDGNIGEDCGSTADACCGGWIGRLEGGQ